jgi:6-pyruvoyltetrahydropterin/6-carboxytetrahydropterin synthase
MQSFRVQVTKDYLVFCSAHFITYSGHLCESLHGHNYRTSVILEGALDQNWYVFDFTQLKRLTKRLVDELDHRVLLPRDNPLIRLSESDGHIHAQYKESRYLFPAQDTVILPIPNTTAEMLAQYLARRVLDELAGQGVTTISAIEVEVEESFGQSAVYREVR